MRLLVSLAIALSLVHAPAMSAQAPVPPILIADLVARHDVIIFTGSVQVRDFGDNIVTIVQDDDMSSSQLPREVPVRMTNGISPSSVRFGAHGLFAVFRAEDGGTYVSATLKIPAAITLIDSLDDAPLALDERVISRLAKSLQASDAEFSRALGMTGSNGAAIHMVDNASALYRFDLSVSKPYLVSVSHASNEFGKLLAIAWLVQKGDFDMLESVEEDLLHPSKRLLEAATSVVHHLISAPNSPKKRVFALKFLGSESAVIRRRAGQSLRGIVTREDLPFLNERLSDSDIEVRCHVANAILGIFGRPLVSQEVFRGREATIRKEIQDLRPANARRTPLDAPGRPTRMTPG